MEDFLWVEKYRPKKVKDVVLPEKLKETFQKFIDDKNIPNLLLSGRSGCGKTTIARALLEELDCDYMVINGSLNGDIDTLRNQILQFASSVSFKEDCRKYIILDEADYLTPKTQAALRNFMEEYSGNCGFILTCNYPHKIIDPLHSRCSSVQFKFTKEENIDFVKQIYKLVTTILLKEKVTFDKKVIVELIKKFFPDIRKMVNELQKYSGVGTIDSGILNQMDEKIIHSLMGYLKDKDFTNARKWVHDHSEINDEEIYTKIYETGQNYIASRSIPQLVLILAKYSYQAAFAANQEINLAACLVEIMVECEFK